MKLCKIRFNIIITVLLVCIFALFSAVSAKDNNDKSSGKNGSSRKEIIVKYKDKTKAIDSKDKVKSKLGMKKLNAKKEVSKRNTQVLEIDETDDINKAVEELKKDSNVLYAQPNYKIYTNAYPKDASFSEQWGLLNLGQEVSGQTGTSGIDIHALEAWSMTMGKQNVIVGVLDTGIDINHEDLKHNIYFNSKEIPDNGIDDDGNGFVDDINGWDFVNNDNTVYDSSTDDVHGTHVAGIIGAERNDLGIIGVAPGVTIMPLKFINGSYGYTSDAIEAIEYAKAMGIKIINCSWGGSEYNPALKEAMENSGILFVCAAGNSGVDVSVSPTYPACFDIDNVISVAAVDNNGNLSRSSNFGSKVDVAAPGTDIISTTPQNTYRKFSGTSMAAAFVTGVSSLMLTVDAESTPKSIKGKLVSSAATLPALMGKVKANGIISAYKALGGSELNIAEDRSFIVGNLDKIKETISGADQKEESAPFEFTVSTGEDNKPVLYFKLIGESLKDTEINIVIDGKYKNGSAIEKKIQPGNNEIIIEDILSDCDYVYEVKVVQNNIKFSYDGQLIINTKGIDEVQSELDNSNNSINLQKEKELQENADKSNYNKINDSIEFSVVWDATKIDYDISLLQSNNSALVQILSDYNEGSSSNDTYGMI